MIELYIKYIPAMSTRLLEEFSEQWVNMPNTNIKKAALLSLINEKLKRYEEEY